MKDRRRHPRYGRHCKARIQMDNLMIVEARILDLSREGAFFELADACVFQQGDRWQLKFHLPGSGFALEMATEVVHSRGKGVGVRFIDIPDFAVSLIDSLDGVGTGGNAVNGTRHGVLGGAPQAMDN